MTDVKRLGGQISTRGYTDSRLAVAIEGLKDKAWDDEADQEDPIPYPGDARCILLHLDALATENAALRERLAEAERLHMELIMAVACKFPCESRHKTALRYIREREDAEVAVASDNVGDAP